MPLCLLSPQVSGISSPRRKLEYVIIIAALCALWGVFTIQPCSSSVNALQCTCGARDGCLTASAGLFTEETDIPRVETVLVARPTQSNSLYTQMVGRGLRLYPGKERLNLIDCVGVSGKASLCTAPTLLGIDLSTCKL